MTTTRRSTRLSILNSKPSTPSTKTWRKKKDDSDNELENLENQEFHQLKTPSKRRTKKLIKDDSDEEQHDKKNLLSPSKLLDRLSIDEDPRIVKTPSKRKGSKKIEEEKQHVSPPKQGKYQKNHLLSPTRLLDRLSIDEKPEKAEEHEDDENSKDFKEKQAELEKKRSKYQNARRVLNGAYTETLPGREKELEELTEFMRDHLESMRSGSLYVSGQPGTGKTACLSKLLGSAEFKSKFSKVYINCTSMKSIGSIYKKICAELKLKVDGKTEKDHQNAIDKYLVSSKKMVLMVLDEVDQLCGKKQEVLYTIFEWPSKQHSKLLLIGIANSLDLTDRLLLRLNVNCELKPKLMHFSSYTKQQIVNIFKSRLEEAGVMDIFPPVTIQLLAAKVSAISGDVRRALDIGRRVVEIAAQQQKTGKELSLKELGIDLEEKPKEAPVQVTQVVKVLNNVYGASQNLNEDMDDAFPLQQKIMLCTLMLMLRNEKNKDIRIGRLHDVYKRVCSKKNIHAMDQAEFVSICELVETRGIIRIMKKKDTRLHKIMLQWDDDEVRSALMDKQLIASILEDTSCLGR